MRDGAAIARKGTTTERLRKYFYDMSGYLTKGKKDWA